ncbi:MAG: hypothetical protein PHW66_09640 [Gallionella sp.]|nr:hypothetical protein [Gallionella sp.]
MADTYGAKPYDYKDYYKPLRGSQLEDTTPIVDKLRAMFSVFGVDQTPVDLNDPNAGIGEKLRGGLGLAPALQPRAVQADVRKSDNAMASPAMPNFGAVPPAPTPAQFAPVATGASQSQVRASDNMIAANSMPVVDGAWAAPHGASPGIGSQLEAGPATTAVSSSRDANGNLVLTNAPPGPIGPGAAPQRVAPRKYLDFGGAYGAAMNQARAAGQDKAARETALKLPEISKQGAEATILSERMKLAAAEPDPARKAAILAGHVMSDPKLQAPPNMQPLPGDKDQSGVVFDPAKGAFRKVPITQAATTANIDAALAGSMKGKTRAQVIQAYKDKGYDVSGVK